MALPRWPLRATSLLTAALLLAPAAGLLLLPRPRAEGLERLLPQASLLQSFSAAPERPVPAIWQERLGARAAQRLWRQQRGIWWQFWGSDGDGGPFLAFVNSAPAATLPAGVIAVDQLAVLAPDPLARRQLLDQLAAARRQRRGLEHRCLERLQQGQSVYWTAIGLAQLTGPLAPLLQQARQGCLSLTASGRQKLDALELDGEAAAIAGVLGAPASRRAPTPAAPAVLTPGTLLELSGPSLAPLLDSLLARQLIREPLAARYGLGDSQTKLLTSVPFRLRLRSISQGPFKAAIDLHLAVGGDRRPWAALLRDLRQGLLNQNLQEAPAKLARLAPGSGSLSLPASRFLREDGTVVGGWRWRSGRAGEPQLHLFLGPAPSAATAPEAPAVDAGSRLQLVLRPGALNRLKLMPPGLPQLVRGAKELELILSPSNQPLSQLTGRLRLREAR
jgi:hypothetical protein